MNRLTYFFKLKVTTPVNEEKDDFIENSIDAVAKDSGLLGVVE